MGVNAVPAVALKFMLALGADFGVILGHGYSVPRLRGRRNGYVRLRTLKLHHYPTLSIVDNEFSTKSGKGTVPEPSSILLLCGGLVGVAGYFRRHHSSKA